MKVYEPMIFIKVYVEDPGQKVSNGSLFASKEKAEEALKQQLEDLCEYDKEHLSDYLIVEKEVIE